MTVTKLPQEGDKSDVVRRLEHDFYFDYDGLRYEANAGEWVVISYRYGKNSWIETSMREASFEEIEEARGPVRWWQLVRRRALTKRIPKARLISGTDPA